MDRTLSYQQKLQRLVETGDCARVELESGAKLLLQKLDVSARLKSSLRTNPTGWILGSLASGLGLSVLFRRNPANAALPDRKKRSLPITLLGLTLTAVRPFANVWFADLAKIYLARHLKPASTPQRTR